MAWQSGDGKESRGAGGRGSRGENARSGARWTARERRMQARIVELEGKLKMATQALDAAYFALSANVEWMKRKAAEEEAAGTNTD